MGSCDGCSRVSKQFLLLLWKNFILQIRRPIGTAFEVILPIVAVIFILVLRLILFKSEDKCFVTFDSDPLSIPTLVPNVPPFPPLNGSPSSPLNTSIPTNLTLDQANVPIVPPAALNFYNVFYSPLTDEAVAVFDILAEMLPNSTFNISGFEDEATMVANLQSADARPSGCFRNGAGVVFESLDGTDLSYKIRLRHEVGSRSSWTTDLVAPSFETPGPRIENFYLSEGFLHLQQLVSQAIIQWKANMEGIQVEPVDVSVRQFPYPPYQVDIFLDRVSSVLPLLLVMAFLYSAGIIVKELVLEKESRIRESMLMMGLKQWVLWSTWYLKQFLFLLISVIIMSILLKAVVFTNSDFLLILIFFTLFILSMISFCFFVSVWFDSSRVGLIVGFVAWFVNYFPILFLTGRYDELSLGAKVGACIMSNTCVGLGVEVLGRLEQRQEGLTWRNVASPLSVDDDFHMAWVFGMFIIDSILYMVIAWYVNAVKPGEYGVPKPFYFPFLPSYWCEGLKYSKVKAVDETELMQLDPAAHEEEPKSLTVGISIRNLTKIYSEGLVRKLINLASSKRTVSKKAVDNLSLNMYKGQVTALLGHNGAGKTTTMSILTGLYTPTSGGAEISGYSILKEMDLIRHSLGICPQHNILFDRLTVSEHLSFFLRLKGIFNKARVRQEVDDMIADLQLTDKSKIQSSRLSGGMKRKLSVGIALIGGSDVVILDEPTSGMDPYARRATWDLLVKHKPNRTILLTTHFMDEADLLGDRIAIMAEGKLCCSGSSLFLKSRYGVGYHMTVVKEPSCVSARVEDLVRSYVPSAEQVTDVGAELSFILPANATTKFPELFDSLDDRKVELGVSSFGVSVTTMEEVFMKVGEGSDETLENRLRRKNTLSPHRTTSPPPIGQTRSPPPQSPPKSPPPEGASPPPQDPEANSEKSVTVIANLTAEETIPLPGEAVPLPSSEKAMSHPSVLETAEVAYRASALATEDDLVALNQKDEPLTYNFKPNTGVVLWLQQFWGMFVKRFYNSLRFYTALVSQLFLPLLFVLFALIVIVTAPARQEDDAPRAMRIDNSAQTLENATVFFAQFGGNLDFSAFQAGDIRATDYSDLTDEARAIWQDVMTNPPATLEECCRYEYQLLDKQCALKSAGELAEACPDADFGYARCRDCLACCNATDSTLPSCSRPRTFITSSASGDFCPSPPSLPLSLDVGARGPLDSDNTFVAEHLVREAVRLSVASFFRRFQAGFTFTAQDPLYSVCSCQSDVANVNNSGACSFLNTLKPCDPAGGQCSVYSFQSAVCPEADQGNFSREGRLCDRAQDSCYSVDPTSADLVRYGACNAVSEQNLPCAGGSLADRVVSRVHPEQSSTPAVTVWYNNAPFHMPAAALNAFHNIYLKNATGIRNITLTVINHPLPRNATTQLDDAAGDPTGFGLSILVVFGYSFLFASFVLFIVTEKESKAKHLQFVSGVSPTSYWLSAYVWDIINAFVPIILSVILFAVFQVEAFSGAGLGAVFIILVLSTWASVPITYIFSFVFSNPLAAYGVLMLIFFFFPLFALTIVFLVQITVDGNATADALHFIFLISPTYGLSAALSDIFMNQNTLNVCEDIGRDRCAELDIRVVDNPLDLQRPGVGIICLYMFMEGIIFFMITLLIQRKAFYPELKSLCNGAENESTDYAAVEEPLLRGEDSDVHAEKKKVLSGGTAEDDVVIIKNLRKIYSSHLSGCSIRPAKLAVGGINLAIPSGECFGLLGVNGAGKTTTFSILTGDIAMTSGTAVIAGHDVRTNIKDVQQRIGYCPQFDALIERLTGRELLTMFARLRGIPESQITHVVDTEIRRLDLTKHANKRCGSYSGGNKRKLSTAIALVGNPPIVMLDEPTTGMDPTTRRYLWDVLTNITREGRSIILTSHSMEECEALCTRLAIMVNGTFKCLGSIQHLKNKYGSGFTLQAKVKLATPLPPPSRETSATSPIRRTLSLRNPSQNRSASLRRSASLNRSSSLRRSASREAQQPSDTVEITLAEGGEENSVHTESSGTEFNPYDTTALHSFIKEAFPGALLLEEHQGAVTYQLSSSGVTWSSVFRQLEQNKIRLGIVDYSVSQTTLDQVFINFAKEQHEEDL